ncbi:MAG TPA: VOC family protein, partial [Candidatus Thermoplasmatota archaeon]|nr:VOC family protein [Candidatus Thermoplasmatota archaeon]
MAKGLWAILNVDNVDKSLEFYRALGLKAKRETMGPMAFGSIATGADAGVVLWNKNEVAPGQAEDTRAWLSGELGKGVLLAFGVADARRAWEKAQAARMTVDQPLREQEWGGFEFT